MNHVVLDLEFNKPENNKYVNIFCHYEIIEIGAIKLDENLNYLDNFRVYVKPNIYKKINPIISDMTQITTEDLYYGFSFDFIIDKFIKWIDGSQIYTWSNTDFGVMKYNCSYHKIDYTWMRDYIDLQLEYQLVKDLKRKPSLENVIQLLELEKSDSLHQALHDAKYTVEVLKYIKQYHPAHIMDFRRNRKINSEKHDLVIPEIIQEKYEIISNEECYCPQCSKSIQKIFETEIYNVSGKVSGKRYDKYTICTDCNILIRTIYLLKVSGNTKKHFMLADLQSEQEVRKLKGINKFEIE